MLKIDKGVQVPDTKSGPRAKYPFKIMEVGDSFFVPGQKSGQFSPNVSWAKKQYGINLTARTVTENGVEGVRVWRIE